MDAADMTIRNISCMEEGAEYVFSITPSPRPGVRQVLRRDATGQAPPVAAAEPPKMLRIAKTELETLELAYVTLEQGSDRSMPVQVFTGMPKIKRVNVDGGSVSFLFQDSGSLRFPGKFFLRAAGGDKVYGRAYVDKPDCTIRLAALGIAGMETATAEVSFYYRDSNGADVFSAPAAASIFLSGMRISALTTDGRTMTLRDTVKTESRAVAGIAWGGTVFTELPLVLSQAGLYTLSLQTLRLPADGCGVSAAYDDGVSRSPWGQACPLILEKPEYTGLAYSGDRVTISFAREALYACGGQRVYAGSLNFPLSEEKADVRFAAQIGGGECLGPAVTVPFASPRYYRNGEGYYCGSLPSENPFAETRHPLTLSYSAFSNDCFRLEEAAGKWNLVIGADAAKSPRLSQCFQGLLEAACTGERAGKKLEELRGAAGKMWMKPQDILHYRYGFNVREGYCDLWAGNFLCAEYAAYQNIPEERGVFYDDTPDRQSDKNLSGFTGVGTADYHVVRRGGNLTVEPFLTALIEAGSFSVPAPDAVGGTSRQCGGAGVFDLLFRELRGPFLRLVYPPVMTDRYRASHGSMLYYDNACVLSSSNYADLQSATDSLRNGCAPLVSTAAHTFLRGRAALSVRITVLADGAPLVCPLGTTLGDLMDRLGLESCPGLRRMAAGLGHIPFDSPDPALPLCPGDRVTLT